MTAKEGDEFRYTIEAATFWAEQWHTGFEGRPPDWASPPILTPDLPGFVERVRSEAKSFEMKETSESEFQPKVGQTSAELLGYLTEAYRWATNDGDRFIEFVGAVFAIYETLRRLRNGSHKATYFKILVNGREFSVKPGEDVGQILRRSEMDDVR